MAKRPVSKNVARLNEDVRRELVDIIGNMKDPRLKSGLLTITRAQVASDLSQVKGHVRSEIAARMHIRKAPELVFIEDDGAAYADHINRLLKDLQ